MAWTAGHCTRHPLVCCRAGDDNRLRSCQPVACLPEAAVGRPDAECVRKATVDSADRERAQSPSGPGRKLATGDASAIQAATAPPPSTLETHPTKQKRPLCPDVPAQGKANGRAIRCQRWAFCASFCVAACVSAVPGRMDDLRTITRAVGAFVSRSYSAIYRRLAYGGEVGA